MRKYYTFVARYFRQLQIYELTLILMNLFLIGK